MRGAIRKGASNQTHGEVTACCGRFTVTVLVFPAARFQLCSVSVETTIELGYAGVVIGRVTVAGEIDENSLFLPVPDPLPVGTRVSLKIDGRTTAARVIGVTETAEAGKAGMRVRVTDTGASVEAAPAPAQAPVTAPVLAEAAAPVAPASVTPSQ